MRPERGRTRGAVVKVGGSLVVDRGRLTTVLARLAEGDDGAVVIVPGGGPFADAARVAQGALGFSDRLAHRLALDAMGRMAEVFSELEPRLPIVRGVAEAEAALADGRTSIWDPCELRDGWPGIAENWHVTSDSLALWLATRSRAGRCILVKSAPCPEAAGPAELAHTGLVDRAFPDFARAFGGEIVIRGPHGDRMIARTTQIPPSPPPPHPEVRGEAEPRRSPPEAAAIPGGLLRGPLARAPQDEGGDGTTVHHRRLDTNGAAA